MAVEFDEPTIPIAVRRAQTKNSGAITNFFIKIGIAKDEKSAQSAMIVVAIIFLALSAYVFYAKISGPKVAPEVLQAEQSDILNDLDRAGRGR